MTKTKEAKRIEVKEGDSCPTCGQRPPKHNGWSNYETWVVASWLDNEEESQDYWSDAAEEAVIGAKKRREPYSTPEETATYRLAKRLEEEIKDVASDLGASLCSDMLNAALSEVHWYEIAKYYIDKYEEEKNGKRKTV